MDVHTMQELKQFQAMPLPVKIAMTQTRIRAWVDYYGKDGVYVSFSCGKDSTVLLHLVRELYPDIPAVFVDTGLEYPEIREFVKTFDNVTWVKPKLTFRQVIDKYGYPFISKEVSNCVSGARKYLVALQTHENVEPSDDVKPNIPNAVYMADILGVDRRENKLNPDFLKLKSGDITNYRVLRLLGELKNKEGSKSKFNQTKYAFFLNAPFEISDKCCNVMKKAPAHTYEKETHRFPILATMTEESNLRRQKWLQEGCNAFECTHPHSKPMSFWTEQDVLKYIKINNIPICSVYGDIVEDVGDDLQGQIRLFDMPTGTTVKKSNSNIKLPTDNPLLKTTGCTRTGCMFCGFGCHLEKEGDGRFERMKITHPMVYDYLMRPWEEEYEEKIPDKRFKCGYRIIKRKRQGLNYKEVIDWINENGNMHIRY